MMGDKDIHTQWAFPVLIDQIHSNDCGQPKVIVENIYPRCHTVGMSLKQCGWEASFWPHRNLYKKQVCVSLMKGTILFWSSRLHQLPDFRSPHIPWMSFSGVYYVASILAKCPVAGKLVFPLRSNWWHCTHFLLWAPHSFSASDWPIKNKWRWMKKEKQRKFYFCSRKCVSIKF